MHNLNDLIPLGTGWNLTAGRGISDAGRIVGLGTAPNGERHGFVLEPILGGGDLNCDGAHNVQDVAPFVPALVAPAAYAQQFLGCNRARADTNADGAVDGRDIHRFIELLAAP